jgi:hypothetical protein
MLFETEHSQLHHRTKGLRQMLGSTAIRFVFFRLRLSNDGSAVAQFMTGHNKK